MVKTADTLGVGIAEVGHRDFCCQQVLRIESPLDLLKTRKTGRHKGSANQQDERESHLGDHQGTAEAAVTERGSAPATFFEGIIQVKPENA